MTKIILAHELLEAGDSKSHIAQHLGVYEGNLKQAEIVQEAGLECPM